MKSITLTKKDVHYKIQCLEQAGFDTTVGKIYDCVAEGYLPEGGDVFFYQIIDDAGDEHAVLPEFFEKVN